MATKFMHINMTEHDYITLTAFERNFDLHHRRTVFKDYWIISAYAAAIYILFVFGGMSVMKARQPLKLNGLLTVWNIGLAVMSALVFSRCLPEFLHILSGENGFHNSICEWKDHSPATAFWSYVILLAKVVELGDTVFIVLRKQNLQFLHWYYHFTTLMSWWLLWPMYEPVYLWYVVMNSFVNILMYTHSAIRTMKIRIPKMIALLITTCQGSQMIVALILNIYSIWIMYLNGAAENCPHRSWPGIKVSCGMYIPLTYMFVKLLINSYVIKGKVKCKKA